MALGSLVCYFEEQFIRSMSYTKTLKELHISALILKKLRAYLVLLKSCYLTHNITRFRNQFFCSVFQGCGLVCVLWASSIFFGRHFEYIPSCRPINFLLILWCTLMLFRCDYSANILLCEFIARRLLVPLLVCCDPKLGIYTRNLFIGLELTNMCVHIMSIAAVANFIPWA